MQKWVHLHEGNWGWGGGGRGEEVLYLESWTKLVSNKQIIFCDVLILIHQDKNINCPLPLFDVVVWHFFAIDLDLLSHHNTDSIEMEKGVEKVSFGTVYPKQVVTLVKCLTT